MDLIVPDAKSLRPLDQCAALLLLGQGFSSKAEFLVLARTTADNICGVAPFGSVKPASVNAGRLAIFADACLGVDLGVTSAPPAAPRALGIGTGAAIEQALGGLDVPAVTATTSTQVKADTAWSLSHFGGATTKLIAIVRKPPTGARPGEYYSLPIVVVDVDPARDWWRLIVRALAQGSAGLVDEFTRDGPDRAAPPPSALAEPRNLHVFGRNTITIDATEAAKLGTQPIADIFGDHIDPAWKDRFSGVTPYRSSALGPVTAGNAKATIRLVQGAAGYRSGVLRCDQPCLLAQAPAELSGPTPRPTPIRSEAMEPESRPSVSVRCANGWLPSRWALAGRRATPPVVTSTVRRHTGTWLISPTGRRSPSAPRSRSTRC